MKEEIAQSLNSKNGWTDGGFKIPWNQAADCTKTYDGMSDPIKEVSNMRAEIKEAHDVFSEFVPNEVSNRHTQYASIMSALATLKSFITDK